MDNYQRSKVGCSGRVNISGQASFMFATKKVDMNEDMQ